MSTTQDTQFLAYWGFPHTGDIRFGVGSSVILETSGHVSFFDPATKRDDCALLFPILVERKLMTVFAEQVALEVLGMVGRRIGGNPVRFEGIGATAGAVIGLHAGAEHLYPALLAVARAHPITLEDES